MAKGKRLVEVKMAGIQRNDSGLGTCFLEVVLERFGIDLNLLIARGMSELAFREKQPPLHARHESRRSERMRLPR